MPNVRRHKSLGAACRRRGGSLRRHADRAAAGRSILAELLDPEFSLKGSTRISYYAFPIGYAITRPDRALSGPPVQLSSAPPALLFLVMVCSKGRTMVADALATALLVALAVAPGTSSLLRAALLTVGMALTGPRGLVTGGSIFINVLMDGYGKIAMGALADARRRLAQHHVTQRPPAALGDGVPIYSKPPLARARLRRVLESHAVQRSVPRGGLAGRHVA